MNFRTLEPPLEPDPAVRALLGDERATVVAAPEAARLAEQLGRLRPALSLARAFMRRSRIDVLGFEAEWSGRVAAAAEPAPRLQGCPIPLLVCFGMAVDAAAEEEPASRGLLDLLSLVAAAPLPRSMLERIPGGPVEGLCGSALEAAIDALAGFGLAEIRGAVVEVSEIIHTIARGHLGRSDEAIHAPAMLRMVVRAMPERPDDERHRALMNVMRPHAQAIAAAAYDLEPLAAARLMRTCAIFDRATGNLSSAGWLLSRSLPTVSWILGDDDPEVADWQARLGEVRLAMGRPRQAVRPLEQALASIDEDAMPHDPRAATWLGWLVEACRGYAQPVARDAILAHVLHLSRQRKMADEMLDRWYTALTRGNAHEPGSAEADAAQAALVEAHLGPDAPGVLSRLRRLSLLYDRRGETAKAKQVDQRFEALIARLDPVEHGPGPILEAFGHREMARWLRERPGQSGTGR